MEHMKNCAPIFVRVKNNLMTTDNDKDDIFWRKPSKCHLFLMPKIGSGFKTEG